MKIKNRHSIRLKNYDYSSNGAYFITICTQNRELLFGNINNDAMVLNNDGQIVQQHIESLTQHFSIQIPIYQIMSNHVHLLILIVGAGFSRPITLGNIIAYFKYQSTKQINNMGRENPAPTEYKKIFQRNYYEHIIRNEKDLEEISWYITNNPLTWEKDQNNLENLYI